VLHVLFIPSIKNINYNIIRLNSKERKMLQSGKFCAKFVVAELK